METPLESLDVSAPKVAGMEEKRAYVRRIVSLEGEAADALGEHWFPIKLIDLSLGGLGFLSNHPMSVGTVRMVRVKLNLGEPQVLRANVRIANSIPHSLFKGYRVGAEFVRLDDAQRALLEWTAE